MMTEAIYSSETVALERVTRRQTQKDGILHSHGLTFQKSEFFIVAAVKTSNLTYFATCFGCYLRLTLFLIHRYLSPWWRRYVLPKRRFLQEPHGVTSHKTEFFTGRRGKRASGNFTDWELRGWGLFHGSKFDHPLLSSANIEMEWNYSSTLPHTPTWRRTYLRTVIHLFFSTFVRT
jgi:hypothetical protein